MLAMCLALVFSGILCKSAKIQVIEASGTLEAGDWIKYQVTTNPVLKGEVTPTWIKFEFSSVEGTSATVQTTMHLSDGDEYGGKTTIDLLSGSNSGLIIPPNSKIADSICISGYGKISIEGETTSIYAGANRATVFARYSNSTDSATYFWDKQVGIMLEQNVTQNESNTIWKIADTNIWQTQLDEYNLYQTISYLVIILAVVLALVIFLRLRRKKFRQTKKKTGRR